MPTGTYTEQLAYLITKEITANIDFFLDIHGGDASEDLLPFICYYDRKDKAEQTGIAKQLCEQSGMKYIVSYPYNLTATEPAKYAFKHATQQGIPSLSIEAGKLGTVQRENVTLIRTAVRFMLAHLRMYAPIGELPAIAKMYLNDQTYIRVPERGIFYSDIKSGDQVKKGALLGYIVDQFGHNRVDVFSPVDGVVLYKIGTPPVNKGETLFCIGQVNM